MTNPTPELELVGGIDSHTDTIHVALITALGRDVADHEFATTASGYRTAVVWLGSHGQVTVVGVEGTSSYGRGVTTALAEAGIRVVEVNRTPGRAPPPRKERPPRRLPRRPLGALRRGVHAAQGRFGRAAAGPNGGSPLAARH